MKIKLKTLSDKITAVVLYLICMTIVITMFLEVSYMADYGFYDKVGTTQDTFYTLMEEKVDKEYSDIEKFVLITFEKEAENKLEESNIDNSTAANYTENPLYSNKRAESEKDTITYKTLCDKYQNHNKTNLIIVATSNNKMYTLGEPAASLNEETCFETTRTTSFYDVTIKGMRPVTIQIKIKKDLSADDTFRLTARLIKTANNLKYFIVFVMFIALVTGMAIVAVLMVNINYTPGHMRFIDKIPFDLFTILTVAMNGFVISMIVLMSADKTREDDIVLWNAACAILAFVVFCIMLIYFLSLAVRIKAGHIFRNTLIYKAIERIRRGKGGSKESGYFKMPFVGKLIIIVSSVLALDLGLIIFNYFRFKSKGLSYNFSVFALIQVTMAFIVGTLLFVIAINFNRLRESGNRLANGDYGENLDSKVMFGDFKAINDNFITLKDDVINALEEKNKNEKMRSELIANISHDIKTPLTSIINYTDIISSGKCSEAELNEYYEIINKQSKRLTNLLQNLIDVSQITTGSVKINLDSLNLGIFISQILDDFGSKLEEKNLTFEDHIPQEDIYITADGQKLWRIFENLLSNISKYAMPNTRVYLNVMEIEDSKVKIELKNISEKKIESTPEELLERFARGDSARNTDGNGLGLSIIQSLTELQGGKFEIAVDGDLFKAILIFDKAGIDAE